MAIIKNKKVIGVEPKEITPALEKYKPQVNVESEVSPDVLWDMLAQIGDSEKHSDTDSVFNAGTCFLDYTVAPNRVSKIFQYIVTGGAAAGAWTKKITLINPNTGELFSKGMEEGVWQNWQGGYKYMHILTRYNNDSMQYPMGWFAIINEKKTMSFANIASWLYTNGYTSPETSYGYLQGGCCGTTAVRNSADTGASYVGRVMSGVYSTSGTDLNFKWDYNGTTTNIQSARCRIISVQL